jgi:hypothetical protein
MRQRVAALGQEFERVVEAGGVGLPLIGDRPQLGDVVAEQFRRHRGLPRRHPVDVAAQRVDLAIVRHHAIRMRQRPARERVGGEALVHQAERGLEVLLVQIGIVLAELVGEEHALVDHGAARQRHDVVVGKPPLAPAIDHVRDHLAQDVELALELVLRLDRWTARDEHLHVERLGRLHRFPERGIVVRHLAPAEQDEALLRHLLGIDVEDQLPPFRIVRHEHEAGRVVAGLGQCDAELAGLAPEEGMRGLHQDAGAVAGARVGADRTAMLEIAQDVDRVLDDLVRLAALDVGDEADAA